MKETAVKKVVLAYSGGLDTSFLIPWLKEQYNCEVIAVAGNVGQDDIGLVDDKELVGLEEKAKKAGASKCYVEDLRHEFVNDYIFPTMQAGAVYEGQYLLGTSFARPVIARRIVEIALHEGADAIVHGCTGKGNDQVRFELTIKHFAPEMKIIAPWRMWDFKGRDDLIEYAKENNYNLPPSLEKSYSRDRNLWHLSHEGQDLEYPENEPKYDDPKLLQLGKTPEKAPDKPQYVTIGFEAGKPISIDGKVLDGVELIKCLNVMGGENGIGILDIVENRLVGMKSRGIYETPGGTILYKAHKALETITVDRDTSHQKEQLGVRFAELVYNGQWFTPLREALSAFVEKTQQNVTGKVRLKLYKGNIILAGIESEFSLYDAAVAGFDAGNKSDSKDDSDHKDFYDHKDAEGFINILGLPIKVAALGREGREKKQG